MIFCSIHSYRDWYLPPFQLACADGSLLAIMLVLWSVRRHNSSLARLPIIGLVDLSCHFYGVALGYTLAILDTREVVGAEECNCSHTPCPAVGKCEICDIVTEY